MNVKGNLIKLIKGNPMITLAAAIAIAAFITYVIIFIPMTSQIRVKYPECRRCENDVMNTRNIIEYARAGSKSYGGRILISEKEAAIGIEEFTEHAKELGINFLSVKPQNIILKEGVPYKIMPIELELEANDKQFVDFLGSIDELKKAIITVNNFDITPNPDDHTRLHAKMVIDIYLSTSEGAFEEL